VKQFTGKDSAFEEPNNPDLVVDTEALSEEGSISLLLESAEAKVKA
jgi:adenylylsulfate kinase-like enzyme